MDCNLVSVPTCQVVSSPYCSARTLVKSVSLTSPHFYELDRKQKEMVKVYSETSFGHLPGEIKKTKSNFNQFGQISILDMNPEICKPPAPNPPLPAPDFVVYCCAVFNKTDRWWRDQFYANPAIFGITAANLKSNQWCQLITPLITITLWSIRWLSKV
jgi:hypothetical protein